MKRSLILLILFVLGLVGSAYAGWVDGYYRSGRTYIRGHYRSSPNNTRVDNYDPSLSESDRNNPYGRDYDNDGMSNYLDFDDDNDGLMDDWD